MTVSIADVTNAFKITSGSTNLTTNEVTVKYIKNSNDIPDDVPINVENTSNNFYIKLIPSSSFAQLQVYVTGSSSPLNETNTLIIPPTSSKQLALRLITTLEQYQNAERQETITFNLVAMVPVTGSNSTSSNITSSTNSSQGGTSGGSSDSTSSTTQQPITNTEL